MTCTVMLCSLLPVLGVKSDVDNFEELIELNDDKKKIVQYSTFPIAVEPAVM